jgi:stalled ribosome rescue protein Dom34
MHEQLAAAQTVKNDSAHGQNNNEEQIQNNKNEQLKNFCKAIIEKLENVHSITVFGPSTAKFELQKEIRETKHLKNITEKLLVAD